MTPSLTCIRLFWFQGGKDLLWSRLLLQLFQSCHFCFSRNHWVNGTRIKKITTAPNMELLMNKWSSGRKINSSFPVKYLSYKSFWLKNDFLRTWFRMRFKHRLRIMWIQNMWITLKLRVCLERLKSDLKKVVKFVQVKQSKWSLKLNICLSNLCLASLSKIHKNKSLNC